MTDQQLEKLSLAFKAIALSLRLKIIFCLADGEKIVTEIIDRTGSTQSNISQHLTKMKYAGILSVRKESNMVYYQLVDIRILQVTKLMMHVIEGDADV